MEASDDRTPSEAPTIEYGDGSGSNATADDLEVLIADAREAGDFASAAAYGEQLAALVQEGAERRVALEGIATDALAAARVALEAAIAVGPETEELLERLQRACEAAGRWKDAVSAATRIAEHRSVPAERAAALSAAASLAERREGEPKRAVTLYEAAIEEDPEVEGAFEALERLLVVTADAPGLARAYERQLGRLERKGADAIQRARLLERLAELQSERLDDLRGAVVTLDRVCVLEPTNDDARARKAELHARLGETARAIRAFEIATTHAPFDARLYRRLAALHHAAAATDRACAASAVLVALGDAEPAEQQLYAEYAPRAPLSFARTFDTDVWKALEPAGYPALVGELFEVLDQAAVAAWVDAAKSAGIPVTAPEQNRIDPKSSTVAAVRSFEWASKVLGVAPPALYARPEVSQVAMATVRAEQPAVVLGRAVLTGRSVIELGFLSARHATYLRPGFRLLSFYPTGDELKRLLRAAIAMARIDGVPASADPKTQQTEQRLRRHIGEEGLRRVRDVITRINAADTAETLSAWVVGVELIACRAALLASGDVTVATPLLGVAGSSSAGLSARARMKDLYPFSVSDQAARLRASLGVQVTG